MDYNTPEHKYDFSMFTPGNERIDFQKNNNFFRELISIFQLGFTYRETIDLTPVANKIETEQRNFKIKKIINYVTREIFPKFKKCVLDNTNLEITKVKNTGTLYGATGMFAVDLSFDDFNAASATIDRVTGVKNVKFTDAIEEMTKFTKNFDVTTGKLSKPDKKIAVDIYFDISYAYCLYDFYNINTVKEFTAEELAAIMLHEIGHALTVVERARDYFFQQRRFLEHLNYIKQHDDVIEAFKESYWDIKESLEDMEKNNKDSKTLKVLIKVVDKVHDLLTDIEPSMLITLLSTIGNIIIPILSLIGFYSAGTAINILVGNELGRLIDAFRLNTSDGKTSDTMSTLHNLRFCERMADEFVSMHGAGHYLSSGLSKLYGSMVYMQFGSIMSVSIRRSLMFSLYFKLVVLFIRVPMLLIAPSSTYEENYKRLERLAQNAIIPLKDKNISGEMRDALVSSYEECIKNAKNIKNPITDSEIFKSLSNLAGILISPTHAISVLVNGNIRRDYEILGDRLDELMNNKLYYQYNKLLSLK